MDQQMKTANKKMTCAECKNEVSFSEENKEGDVVECEHCGIEYEIVGADNGEFVVQMIEEEK